MLLLLGGGVVANTALTKTKGNGTGFLFVNFGWGLAVFAGVLVSQKSGAHLNPAVTLGIAAQSLAKGQPVDWGNVFIYLIAQLIGAIIGAVLCWLAYKEHFDNEPDPATKLGVFSTGPQYRSATWNVITEAIATFVLVFVILAAGLIANGDFSKGVAAVNMGWLNALGVALLVVGIGASLGGPTGYAINPARDLGPRIAHAFLPIKGKGDSDWGYSWIPVVGPIIGGVLAGICSAFLLPV
jgi:glycerol uptake facilitator protein